MDPFIASELLVASAIIVFAPIGVWLLPKLDRAAGRLSDYLDARKARKAR